MSAVTRLLAAAVAGFVGYKVVKSSGALDGVREAWRLYQTLNGGDGL